MTVEDYIEAYKDGKMFFYIASELNFRMFVMEKFSIKAIDGYFYLEGEQHSFNFSDIYLDKDKAYREFVQRNEKFIELERATHPEENH